MTTLETHFKPTKCNVCGDKGFKLLAIRADQVRVLSCAVCEMGVIESIPYDTSVLYQNNYYEKASGANSSGYVDYDTTSEHGVLWAAELLKLLKPFGRVLDIGCANGYLLDHLGLQYEKFGIEASYEAAQKAALLNIKIIGSDILEPQLVKEYENYFDVITAIAIFEHVTDFRGAIEASLRMLKPNGILIFEVPLISDSNPNETWFTTSLEHIYYPSKKGIRTLFDEHLKVQMFGQEFVIRDYASTYIGLATGIASDSEQIQNTFRKVFSTNSSGLTDNQKRAQLMLHVIHGADTATADIDRITDLFPDYNLTPFLARCLAIWKADVLRLRSKTEHLNKIEDASQWNAENANRWETQYEKANSASLIRKEQYELRIDELTKERDIERGRSEAAFYEKSIASSQLTEIESKYLAAMNELHQVYRSKSWTLTSGFRYVVSSLLYLNKLLRRYISAFVRLFSLNRIRTGLRLLKDRNLSNLSSAIIHTSRENIKASRRETTVKIIAGVPLEFNQPIVTVVIPCYNYGRFVTEAIDSILAQSIKNIEIIVVDGGSTDPDTLQILQSLSKPKTRFVFREGRHLVGDNRNYGISIASGRYICCLDADDTVDPTYLEKALFHLETYGYDVVSTAINFVGAKSGTVDILEYPDLHDMAQGNHVLTCGVFRRSLWESVGGYFDVGVGKDHVAEDWDFWLRLAATGARIRNLSREYLFNYRIHLGGSLSSAADTKNLESQKLEILKRNQNLLTPDLIKASRKQQAHHLFSEPTSTGLARGELATRRVLASQYTKSMMLTIPFALVGGAERLLSGLCTHLLETGWHVTLVTTLAQDSKFGSSIDWFKRSQVEVFTLPTFLDEHEKKDFLKYLAVTRQPSCLLNAGSRITYELLPQLTMTNPTMAVVDLLFNKVGHVDSHLEFRKYFSYVLAENAEVEDWFKQVAKWPSTRISTVSSGINLGQLKPSGRPVDLVKKYNLSESELVIGFSGRFSIEKRPEVFLQIALLSQHIPNLRFFMTGAGPLAEEIRLAATSLPKSARLEFVGLVDDVYDFLHLYDVLLLPSQLDGRPIVVLEALACGVPVIASNIGGLPALIEPGENGYLVETMDIQGFVNRIELLQSDRSLLSRLKLNSRLMAEQNLDAQKAYQAYETALGKAMDLHKHADSEILQQTIFS